ncbi:MAG: hypothetical protein HN929_07685 [Chloroflexi bacterium]|jgi:hypothetical protein|nr:hypothetical protein [Chloroflexota bacterium]MBT7081330.1 hypothetical protein [Chloroflexota bacterium]MBT7290824.1 hypothetical protein [Chloroflexota bacterium]
MSNTTLDKSTSTKKGTWLGIILAIVLGLPCVIAGIKLIRYNIGYGNTSQGLGIAVLVIGIVVLVICAAIILYYKLKQNILRDSANLRNSNDISEPKPTDDN